MPDFSLEFEVYCNCGEGLCNQSSTEIGRNGMHHVTITPCGMCLKSSREEGYSDGFEEGRQEGYDEGSTKRGDDSD